MWRSNRMCQQSAQQKIIKNNWGKKKKKIKAVN